MIKTPLSKEEMEKVLNKNFNIYNEMPMAVKDMAKMINYVKKRDEWVSLDELKKKLKIIGIIIKNLDFKDLDNAQIKSTFIFILKENFDKFFPSKNASFEHSAELNTSPNLVTRGTRDNQPSQEGRAEANYSKGKHKSFSSLSKSSTLPSKSKLYCESHRGFPYSCEFCGRAFSKGEGICYCGGTIRKASALPKVKKRKVK